MRKQELVIIDWTAQDKVVRDFLADDLYRFQNDCMIKWYIDDYLHGEPAPEEVMKIVRQASEEFGVTEYIIVNICW